MGERRMQIWSLQVWQLCVFQVLLGLENPKIPDFAGNKLRKTIENHRESMLPYNIIIHTYTFQVLRIST